ncbi:ankyrin repeat domain-containing protein [Neisseria montereyensis]|uniref:Ankyrin repeat domain-containing protein n=1 Tax=Neisseria montereyensis TaxID=2973938 RepID=A0ABT2FAB8_9NEIS|nr:ankyrin repeat domain-containing protein [Neisseria montereyensis]MCS4532891.1 ankyrin repeat domain-containing protein [Neisseria montereyensis]
MDDKDKQNYEEMKKEYEDNFDRLILLANKAGDIALLEQMEAEGKLEPLMVTPYENWNYLHLVNMSRVRQSPPETNAFYISRGVDVNLQSGDGCTPLHYAMRVGNGDVALLMLEAGANPNIPDRHQVIPLAMMLAMPDRLDVLEKMLENGGDVHYLSGGNEVGVLEELKLNSSDDKEAQPIIALMEKYA